MTKFHICDFCQGSCNIEGYTCPKCNGKGVVTLTELICGKHIGVAGWALEGIKIVCIEVDENGKQHISGVHDA